LGQTGVTATTSSPAPTSALHRQHQGVHARGGDCDAPGIERSMQAADVVGQRLAQLGQAQVVRIEGLAFA
jgi:hypothetical protein